MINNHLPGGVCEPPRYVACMKVCVCEGVRRSAGYTCRSIEPSKMPSKVQLQTPTKYVDLEKLKWFNVAEVKF